MHRQCFQELHHKLPKATLPSSRLNLELITSLFNKINEILKPIIQMREESPVNNFPLIIHIESKVTVSDGLIRVSVCGDQIVAVDVKELNLFFSLIPALRRLLVNGSHVSLE